MVEIINTPINVSSPPTRKVCIGLYKENDFRQIQFNVTDWLEAYPSGKLSVIYQRADGEIYPVVLNSTDNPVTWKPLLADTCVVGDGRLEVVIKDESTNGKSILIPVCVLASIENADGSTETPDLVLQIIGSSDAAKASADAAAASANAAAESADDSSASADAAAASAVSASEYAEEAKAALSNVGECELGVEDLGDGVANVYHLSGPEYFRPSVLYTRQTLTEEQKAQARQNIGVQSIDDVVTSFNGATGDVRVEFVSSVNGQTGDVNLDASGSSKVKFIFPKNIEANIHSGDASIIQVNDKVVMIDCGRDYDLDNVAMGALSMTNMLEDLNIAHIDYCIITNYRLEHCANFITLTNLGYINSDTVVYLPPYSEQFAQFEKFSQSIKDRHDAIVGKLNDIGGVTVIEPQDDNGEDKTVLEIGGSFKITFMNCDYETFESSSWENYPEYSMCCMVEYGSTKAFYSSDARSVVFDRLIAEGLIDGHVDLFKINFHGERLGATDGYRKFIRTISPDYAVQPSSMYDASQNMYNNSPVLKYLQDVGTHIYSVHDNTDYIVFSSDSNDMNVESGVENIGVTSSIDYTDTIYVDVNTTGYVQDGSEAHPFRELGQALSACDFSSGDHYALYLADGTYNASDDATDGVALGNRLNLYRANVDIYSVSGDPSVCIINGGGTYRDCGISFNNVTLSNSYSSTKAIVELAGGRVSFENCIIDNESGRNRYSIYLHDNAFCYLNKCVVNGARNDNKYSIRAMSGSMLRLQNTSFTNLESGYYPIWIDTCSMYNYYCCKCPEALIGGYDFSMQVVELKITSQPQSINKTERSRATFTVTSAGVYSYRWQHKGPEDGEWVNGLPSGFTGSGEESQSLIINNVASSLNGYQFRCIVADKYGNSLSSDAATLTVS